MAPLYDYSCICGYETEIMVAVDSRDKIRPKCPKCKKRLKRQVTNAALHGEVFQMQAVMSDGSRVAGRFGRSDTLRRK